MSEQGATGVRGRGSRLGGGTVRRYRQLLHSPGVPPPSYPGVPEAAATNPPMDHPTTPAPQLNAPRKLVLMVYKSLIRSHLDCDSAVYGSVSGAALRRLDVLQNECLQSCLKLASHRSNFS